MSLCRKDALIKLVTRFHSKMASEAISEFLILKTLLWVSRPYFLLAWATYVKFGVAIWKQDNIYVAAVKHSGNVVLVKLAYIWKLTLQLMLKFTLKWVNYRTHCLCEVTTEQVTVTVTMSRHVTNQTFVVYMPLLLRRMKNAFTLQKNWVWNPVHIMLYLVMIYL